MRAIKRKRGRQYQSTSKKARLSYGDSSLSVEKNCSPEELTTAQDQYVTDNIKVSKAEIKQIEKETRSQSSSNKWRKERRMRLTASHFGTVVKKRPSTKCTKLVENMLYNNFQGNRYTVKGLKEERNAIQEYINKKKEQNLNVKVYSSGLVIDPQNNYLAASPDGVVEENRQKGLIEIKHVLLNKQIDLHTASKSQSFCLQSNNNVLTLKKSHNFSYQIQGQLAITNKPWCDLVVRSCNPHCLHIERITKNENIRNNEMLPKLQWFFSEALLPEICKPRFGKYPGIREPSSTQVCVCVCTVMYVCDKILLHIGTLVIYVENAYS